MYVFLFKGGRVFEDLYVYCNDFFYVREEEEEKGFY